MFRRPAEPLSQNRADDRRRFSRSFPAEEFQADASRKHVLDSRQTTRPRCCAAFRRDFSWHPPRRPSGFEALRCQTLRIDNARHCHFPTFLQHVQAHNHEGERGKSNRKQRERSNQFTNEVKWQSHQGPHETPHPLPPSVLGYHPYSSVTVPVQLLPALHSRWWWTVYPAGFVIRRPLKLAGRHTHEISKHGCEMRLVLEPHAQRDVDNLRVVLTEKLLRAIDSLLQDKLMRCQAGTELEQFGEVRLAHLCHPGQHANGERFVEIVSDVLDDARQTPRRNAERPLARDVRGLDKGVRQLARQIVRHDACSHHEKIHVVVLNTVTRRVQVMTQSRPHSRVLVGHHGSSDGPGADQHSSFDAARVEGRSELIRCAPVVGSAGIPRRNIFRGMPLTGKSGFETFLTFESDLVRTKPYPHDYS